MELLASLFVGKPLNILALAVLFLAGYLALRFTALGIARRPDSLLIAATAWGLYAAWEWLVQIKTPEANIRVDLLVIWPVLAIFSGWALFRAFR
jgi:ABC-type proline/glycine betaine transport system permease subunit